MIEKIKAARQTIVRAAALGRGIALSCVVFVTPFAGAQTPEDVRRLREENRELRARLDRQQQIIDGLTSKVEAIEKTQLSAGGDGSVRRDGSVPGPVFGNRGAVNISGQIAAGYFKTGSEGAYPEGEFRVDEARVFLDAHAWQDVYGFLEINAMTREAMDDGVRIGEAYIDWERVMGSFGLESLVNFRLGRFHIPFGEEYLVRYAMDNPLISHSLLDFWGIDEGAELYGSHRQFSYVVAVQNGGHPAVGDFTSDKSVAGRMSYQPKEWLRISGSGMRTGDIAVNGDELSEMWFGNGFFRSIGSPATTRFNADLGEIDVALLLPRGHVKLGGGVIGYDDNDPAGNNSREMYFGYAEGVLRFTRHWYGAARYSHIVARDGYPILGHGNWPDYFNTFLTDKIWRWSTGFGYTPSPNVVFKIEYTVEKGSTVGGPERNHEDFFGAQAALRF